MKKQPNRKQRQQQQKKKHLGRFKFTASDLYEEKHYFGI